MIVPCDTDIAWSITMLSNLRHVLVLSAFVVSLGTTSLLAAPINLGTFSGGSHSNSATFGSTVSGSFLDEYLFTTTTLSKVGVTATNDYESAAAFIGGFTISLYSGPPSDTTLLARQSDPNIVTGAGTGFQYVGVKAIEPGGTYYFTVSGSTRDTPSYGGSLNISVSAVPLPATAPMFGAGLLALAGVCAAKRRRTAKPAV